MHFGRETNQLLVEISLTKKVVLGFFRFFCVLFFGPDFEVLPVLIPVFA